MRKHESSQKSTGRWIVRLELILLLAFVCAAASRELRGRSVRQEQRNEAADSGLTAENGEAIEVSATGNYIKWVEFHATCEALAAAYDLVYREKPPYEVISTRWLSYGEVLRLKGVEEMVELYYNSGQFVHTLNFLENAFPGPFAMVRGPWRTSTGEEGHLGHEPGPCQPISGAAGLCREAGFAAAGGVQGAFDL